MPNQASSFAGISGELHDATTGTSTPGPVAKAALGTDLESHADKAADMIGMLGPVGKAFDREYDAGSFLDDAFDISGWVSGTQQTMGNVGIASTRQALRGGD
jgi:hypothetical protein